MSLENTMKLTFYYLKIRNVHFSYTTPVDILHHLSCRHPTLTAAALEGSVPVSPVLAEAGLWAS